MPVGAIELGSIIAVAGLVWSAAQWWMAERAKTRQRDVEMMRWASEVNAVLSDIEFLCEFSGRRTAERVAQYVGYAARASALVEQGRLFFPNVETIDQRTGRPVNSIRVGILDEVLRGYYVAKHLAKRRTVDLPALQEQMRGARKRFTQQLQAEMGRSLKRSGHEKSGVIVAPDPRQW